MTGENANMNMFEMSPQTHFHTDLLWITARQNLTFVQIKSKLTEQAQKKPSVTSELYDKALFILDFTPETALQTLMELYHRFVHPQDNEAGENWQKECADAQSLRQ